MSRLHLAVLDNQRVSLGADVAKDRRAIEGEVEVLGEGPGGIGEEPDLRSISVPDDQSCWGTYTRFAGGIESSAPGFHA